MLKPKKSGKVLPKKPPVKTGLRNIITIRQLAEMGFGGIPKRHEAELTCLINQSLQRSLKLMPELNEVDRVKHVVGLAMNNFVALFPGGAGRNILVPEFLNSRNPKTRKVAEKAKRICEKLDELCAKRGFDGAVFSEQLFSSRDMRKSAEVWPLFVEMLKYVKDLYDLIG